MDGNAQREQTDKVLRTIIEAELDAINRRRTHHHRPELKLKPKEDGGPVTGPRAPALDVVGLALSGGGIRSASFSLGVLQALNEHRCFPRIDYLSTVSGGGYMGSALTATMTQNGGDFVFGKSTGERGGQVRPPDVMDTPEVGHLRNYSNYLIPFGARDLVTALAIITRGLVANVTIVLGIALLFAAYTIYSSPTRAGLFVANFFGQPFGNFLHMKWMNNASFGLTLLLSLAGFVLFLAWAIIRSLQWWRSKTESDLSEFRSGGPVFFASFLILVACIFIFELQPFVIAGMFDLAESARSSGSGYSWLTGFIGWVATIATPVAAVVAFFRQQLGTLLKSVNTSSGASTKLLALAGTAAVWVAGAALPLLIWLGYIHLCYWGVFNDGASKVRAPQAAIHGTIAIQGPGINVQGTVDCRPTDQNPCGPQAATGPQPAASAEQAGLKLPPGREHTPRWLFAAADSLGDPADTQKTNAIALFYLILGLLLTLLSVGLTPNANSLHRLYRDRLSKAFLFDPTQHVVGESVMAGDRDFVPLDTIKISDLVPPKPEIPHAPYQLINATLNIQGSDFANRRGRNADFFLFSPFFIGSEATHYAGTREVERATGLDLPTAMSISGAAFSPNAGATSIRPLVPTLALLNVRTGYWMKNPRFIAAPHERPRHRFWTWFYLLSELTGRLYENSKEVFISDGGHIENLGVYQLLRRRCRIIIVVDAEADPAMRFPSFITLQRYARIDLGVRINMPWDNVRETTVDWMGFSDTKETPPEEKTGGDKHAADPARWAKRRMPSSGPHTAIGTIDYGDGEQGWLVYIKSSLTGDENDYVRDYGRRYQRFPHESTGDQFFSEEQFEAYRALGFHIANRLLNGTDVAQVYDEEQRGVHLNIRAQHPNVDPLRRALFA